jgi:hypothetical protein
MFELPGRVPRRLREGEAAAEPLWISSLRLRASAGVSPLPNFFIALLTTVFRIAATMKTSEERQRYGD